MKARLAIAVCLSCFATATVADEYVNSHFTKDGRYVEGHYRSSPNSTRLDNYSTKGNVNPYTGKPGYKDETDDLLSLPKSRERKRDAYDFDSWQYEQPRRPRQR